MTFELKVKRVHSGRYSCQGAFPMLCIAVLCSSESGTVGKKNLKKSDSMTRTSETSETNEWQYFRVDRV